MYKIVNFYFEIKTIQQELHIFNEKTKINMFGIANLFIPSFGGHSLHYQEK